MAGNTKIEWADHTFNPWEGCTKIAPACDNCYAADRAARFGTVVWGGPRRRTSESNWRKPLKWQKNAAKFFAEHGRRQRVFCASLADVFDNQIPVEWRADLWALIRKCPDLNFLLLTKRPQNIAKMKPDFWPEIKDHIWLGTTVENQENAERNIPHLLKHDSAVRFLSCEPMLGPVELFDVPTMIYTGTERVNFLTGELGDFMGVSAGSLGHSIDWVIAGGESGPRARPSNPEWFKALRDQCNAAGVPFLFKQWGEWSPDLPNGAAKTCVVLRDGRTLFGTDMLDEPTMDGEIMFKVGKSKAGNYLDGVLHLEFPEG